MKNTVTLRYFRVLPNQYEGELGITLVCHGVDGSETEIVMVAAQSRMIRVVIDEVLRTGEEWKDE